MMKTFKIIGKISLCLFLMNFLCPDISQCSTERGAVTVKVVRSASVEDLMKAEGYDLKNEHVVEFLRAFSDMNPGLKTLSVLPKGASVRLPLKYISRRETGLQKQDRQHLPGKSQGISPRREAEKQKALSMIQSLASALGEGIAVDKEGIKAFSSGAVVKFSLDTDYFPLLYTGNKRVILDYQGILPPDIGSLIEIMWPEYRIIRAGGGLKNLVPAVLDLFGYSAEASGKVVLGDVMQVEIYPDFTVFKKADTLTGGSFTLLMILKQDEYRLPDELKNFALQRDIRIIEMPAADQPLTGKAAHTVDMRLHDRKSFLERFLTLTGYSFRREVVLTLSDRKEYALEIKADFLLGSGKHLRIIDFSGTLEPYEAYLQKKGIELLSLRQHFNKTEIVLRTTEFLKMRYETDSRKIAALLAQKNRRFRVSAPGIFITRDSGRYFWPEQGIDATLLSSLMSDSVRLIRH